MREQEFVRALEKATIHAIRNAAPQQARREYPATRVQLFRQADPSKKVRPASRMTVRDEEAKWSACVIY